MANLSGLGKMKAFNLNVKGRVGLSKKELEKQKLAEEKAAEAEALKQFVDTFERPSTGISFVKSGVINAGSAADAEASSVQQLYKPSRLTESSTSVKKDVPLSHNVPKMEKPPKKKKDEKKKSNLELFKEELKMMQEEREGRLRSRSSHVERNRRISKESTLEVETAKVEEQRAPPQGSFDNGDPNTTNVYLGNINPKTTEKDLMREFGRYGPLASVKVMWPRTDEERARNRNCGFVAFMNRQDAERAMFRLKGKEIMGYEMKLGWGKGVPIPPTPIYIPPKMLELTVPPPPSGLPFNAQPHLSDLDKVPPPGQGKSLDPETINKILENAVVKVVIPTDRTLLCLIHRMVEFVVKEGPMFEAMIMNREISNPMYRFLFENQSPAHVYYRWRLFSVLQGEHHSKWRSEPFRMFKGGPLWRPPPLNLFMQGMPEELVDASPERPGESDNETDKPKPRKENKDIKRKCLRNKEKERLEEILRDLNPEKQKIQEAMLFCIKNADGAEDVVDMIADSVCKSKAELHQVIATLYLVSDILHNCTAKVRNVSFYRKGIQTKLEDIFHAVHRYYEDIRERLKAEHFKQRVMNCFKVWEDWAVYSSDFLIRLQNIFLGLVKQEISQQEAALEEDIDGEPIVLTENEDEDIDGVPIEDTVTEDTSNLLTSSFKPSKWEKVDAEDKLPKKSSKWEQFEENEFELEKDLRHIGKKEIEEDEDIDGQPISLTAEEEAKILYLEKLKQQLNLPSEDRHAKLREIEVKVLKYQDELESGRTHRSKDLSVSEEVEQYRIRLLKRCIEDQSKSKNGSNSNKSRHDSKSPASRSPKISRKRSRSRSPSRSSKRSPSRSSSQSRTRSPTTRRRRSPSPAYRARR